MTALIFVKSDNSPDLCAEDAQRVRHPDLLIQIRHNHALQPVPPRQRFLPVMMHAPHKERADRSLRQARSVHSYASAPQRRAAARTAQEARLGGMPR